MVSKSKTPKAAVAKAYYPPAERVKAHPKRGEQPHIILKKSLTPGTIVVLLCGRERGRRCIFLKQLDSGHALVCGPKSLNRVPLMPIYQTYLNSTSTKIQLNDSVKNAIADINFSTFKKVPIPKDEKSEFLSETKHKKKRMSPNIDADLLSKIDEGLVASAKSTFKDQTESELLVKYLKTKFSLHGDQYPHLLKF